MTILDKPVQTPPALPTVDFGHPTWTLRTPWWSWRLAVRSVIVTVVVGLLALALILLSLTSGTSPVPVGDVVAALLGNDDRGTNLIVLEWRLPRALLAALFGVALAMSGAIFQSITRNPLGSPDIIGFSAGSYSGALLVILVTGGGYWAVAGGALIGGIVTAIAVFLLAYRRGVQGFRLIIVGIGVSALLGSVNTYLMLRSSQEEMMRAGVWGAGSLNGLSTTTLWPVLIVLAVLIPLSLALSPALRMLELGDDAAAAAGLPPNRVRLAAMVLGVALIALVTAAAGPIAFIALVAPQIARRLTRSGDLALLPTAVIGAVLLTASDFLAQRLFAPVQLPVGILTVSVGGLYFVWLLVREGRRR